MLLENFIENKNKKVLFFSGAGISAESGVPTFRGTNGLWLEHKIDEICNIKNFDQFYDKIIPFYDNLRLSLKDKKHNIAHKFIADLQNRYGSDTIGIVTTNVDEFFEEAGAENVHHVHGNISELILNYKQPNEYCQRIGYEPFDYSSLTEKCKPNVIFFEEGMHYEEGYKKEIYSDLHWILSSLKNEDTLIFIIGSSQQVIPLNLWLNGVKSPYYNVNPVSFNDNTNSFFLFPNEIIKSATDSIPDMQDLILKHLSVLP